MGRHTARDDDRVRSSLRDAAEAYQPDRQAISTRVAQGRAADSDAKSLRRSMLGLRPVATAFAVVGVLVASGVAVRAGTNDDQRLADPPPPAVVPAPVQSGSVTSPGPAGTVGTRQPTGATGGATGTTPPAGTSGTPGAPGSSPPSSSPAAGPSWLDLRGGTGKDSVATWTEKRVYLHNTSALVSLKVTITVPMSASLAEAGKFTTVPNSDVSVVASPSAEALTYTFTLRDGVKLAAGKYEFAAQFTHKSGREATGDSFVVQAATANATAERTGAFS